MPPKSPPGKDRVPITLRLDANIHEALKLISSLEMRSLNTQIEYFLRKCVLEFEPPANYEGQALYAAVDRVEKSIEELSYSAPDA